MEQGFDDDYHEFTYTRKHAHAHAQTHAHPRTHRERERENRIGIKRGDLIKERLEQVVRGIHPQKRNMINS